MNNDFENALIKEFEKLNPERFKVNISKDHLFVCGGLVDPKETIPPSFRARFLDHIASHEQKIHESIVLAEEFKDYFKENTYTDLLVFEDAIASISSLIIIFLESPGSLVELGMFCSKSSFYKKLIIIAPQEETENEDSFIYLGPLEYIRRKEPSSVAIYPWPDPEKFRYEKEYLDDLCHIIKSKLDNTQRQVSYDSTNFGHSSHLIYEIIRLCYPILIGEIELALLALELDISDSEVNRHLYLLTKLGLVRCIKYSNYKYYYPNYRYLKTVNFGKNKLNKISDSLSINMAINRSYVLLEDAASKKRQSAKKLINQEFEEGKHGHN